MKFYLTKIAFAAIVSGALCAGARNAAADSITATLSGQADDVNHVTVGGINYDVNQFTYTIQLSTNSVFLSSTLGTDGLSLVDFKGLDLLAANQFTASASGLSFNLTFSPLNSYGNVPTDSAAVYDVNLGLAIAAGSYGSSQNPTSSTGGVLTLGTLTLYSVGDPTALSAGSSGGYTEDAGAISSYDGYSGPGPVVSGGPFVVGAPVPASAYGGLALLVGLGLFRGLRIRARA